MRGENGSIGFLMYDITPVNFRLAFSGKSSHFSRGLISLNLGIWYVIQWRGIRIRAQPTNPDALQFRQFS